MNQIHLHVRPSRFFFVLFGFFAAAAAMFVLPRCADALELQRLVVDNRGGRLMVRLGVSATDLNHVARTVEQGEHAVFIADATLYGVGEIGNRKPVKHGSFSSDLAWDFESTEYVLTLPGRPLPLRSRRLEDVLAEGWTEVSVDMGPWVGLAPGKNYILKLDLRLERPDVPQWKKDIFFFVSWDADAADSCELNMAY